MDIEAPTPRQHLAQAISAALEAGATGETLARLVIRSGWQPRVAPDPDLEHLDGLLDDGTHVPIEIRHARQGRAVQV